VPNLRRAVAAALGLTLIAYAVACGFDGVGTRGAGAGGNDGGPHDGSDLADALTNEGGGDGGDVDGGGLDAGTDASMTLDGGGTKYGLRVTSGLVALYEFEEDGGGVAHDTEFAGLDLVASDPGKIAWKPHALTFTGDTMLATQLAIVKVVAACEATNELTVEAWVEPAASNGDSRTRIATVAQDNSHLDFALGVDATNAIWGSVESGNDLAPTDMLEPRLSHLVMTRTAADAKLRLYLDGTQVTGELSGTPSPASSWAQAPLFVGNSSESNRPWRGTIHLLALYSRALTPAEIATNHGAGADP
jgi:hypothetical protein